MSPDGEGITRWRRVADDIRSNIGDGIISDALPSELELAARYGSTAIRFVAPSHL
jgi:GntR family phosphonate transport system transcriptional regulator